MACFEYHITGTDSSILNNSKYLNIKAIQVDLLHPDLKLFRTEYMTSDCFKANDIFEARDKVFEIRQNLKYMGSMSLRTKIEVPYKDHEEYIKSSLYIESHGPVNGCSLYPISKTIKENKAHKLVSTDRKYTNCLYSDFYDKWGHEDKTIVELCVYDSFIDEDKDWFDLYC